MRSNRSAAVFEFDRIERLVEDNEPRILQKQSGEQHALHLPAGQIADRPPLEPVQTDGGDRGMDIVPLLAPDPAEQAGLAPQAHGHEVVDMDRERALDIRHLRQVGHFAPVKAAEIDRAGKRRDDADNAFEQSRFAGAVRADHREQGAARDRAIEMMDRGVAVIAEREIMECELRRHRFPHAIAQSTSTHTQTMTMPAASSRPPSDSRISDGGTVGEGCAWSGG